MGTSNSPAFGNGRTRRTRRLTLAMAALACTAAIGCQRGSTDNDESQTNTAEEPAAPTEQASATQPQADDAQPELLMDLSPANAGTLDGLEGLWGTCTGSPTEYGQFCQFDNGNQAIVLSDGTVARADHKDIDDVSMSEATPAAFGLQCDGAPEQSVLGRRWNDCSDIVSLSAIEAPDGTVEFVLVTYHEH